MRTSLLLVLVVAALPACMIFPDAQRPKMAAVPTGEPVAVVDDVKVWTTTSKEKVGETVYKDSSGQTYATADRYEDKTEVHSMKIWYPVQGTSQLSDEEFFKITGDKPALDETMALRDSGKKWNTRGKITLGLGAVGFIASWFVPNPIGRTALMAGGGLAMSGGWYMMYWGAKQMDPESHAVDRSIAERAARNYNQQLVGVSVNKSF